MTLRRGEIYWADLGRPSGTEPGKIRPVIVIQSDLINRHNHPSTIVCILTSKVRSGTHLLRVRLPKRETSLGKDSDVLVDQLRSIDNRRFRQHVGSVPPRLMTILRANLKVILDL